MATEEKARHCALCAVPGLCNGRILESGVIERIYGSLFDNLTFEAVMEGAMLQLRLTPRKVSRER